MTECRTCVLRGDDGLCFAEEPQDCPRGILDDGFDDEDAATDDDLEDDLEEEELAALQEEEKE